MAIMAATYNNAVTSGTSKDEAELRRRNVHSYENANGGQVVKLEAEDKKKLKRQVSTCLKQHFEAIY